MDCTEDCGEIIIIKSSRKSVFNSFHVSDFFNAFALREFKETTYTGYVHQGVE